jgi:hypothetical protein
MATPRAPDHVCPRPAPTNGTGNEIAGVHRTQAGNEEHRHTCPVCTYWNGFDTGAAHAQLDRRFRTWVLQGPVQVCSHGSSAPVAELQALHDDSEGQGPYRHRCAVCAWRFGFRDGVASVVVVRD